MNVRIQAGAAAVVLAGVLLLAETLETPAAAQARTDVSAVATGIEHALGVELTDVPDGLVDTPVVFDAGTSSLACTHGAVTHAEAKKRVWDCTFDGPLDRDRVQVQAGGFTLTVTGPGGE